MDHSVTQGLYAMDMDLFKQAAALAVVGVVRQPPTKIQGYNLLPLIRYFDVQLLFPFFYGKYPAIHMVTSIVCLVRGFPS